MEKFLNDRSKLKEYSSLNYINSHDRPYLFIEKPETLAGLAGYLKFQHNKKNEKVYCRGQINDYPNIPSLFRGDNLTDDRLNLRWNAYNDLLSKTQNLYTAFRFKKENINPIFQHYGIKTPWLDLIDNLFVAIWFATYKYIRATNSTKAYYKKSESEFGHICFFATSPETTSIDLREQNSSLSLRLHSQHGVSMTRNTNNWSINNRNLDDQLVATVKFPNNDDWHTDGNLFKTQFFFPAPKFDNTFKYLMKDKFRKLLANVINEYDLLDDELGSIAVYQD